MEEYRELTTDEANGRIIIKQHLKNLLSYENIYWKQTATIRWIKIGDENTDFFQAKATIKYRNNSIKSLLDENQADHTQHQAKAAILWRAFKNRIGSSNPISSFFNLEELLTNNQSLAEVEAPFTKKEEG